MVFMELLRPYTVEFDIVNEVIVHGGYMLRACARKAPPAVSALMIVMVTLIPM